MTVNSLCGIRQLRGKEEQGQMRGYLSECTGEADTWNADPTRHVIVANLKASDAEPTATHTAQCMLHTHAPTNVAIFCLCVGVGMECGCGYGSVGVGMAVWVSATREATHRLFGNSLFCGADMLSCASL